MSDIDLMQMKRKKEELIETPEQLEVSDNRDLKQEQKITERKTEERNTDLQIMEHVENENFYNDIQHELDFVDAEIVEPGKMVKPSLDPEVLRSRGDVTNAKKAANVPAEALEKSDIAYDMHTQITEYVDSRQRFVNSRLNGETGDVTRYLNAYLMNEDEFEMNKAFLKEEETTVDEYNNQFIKDFLQKNENGEFIPEVRFRHLNRIINQVLNIKFDVNLVDKTFVLENITYVRCLLERANIFENLLKDKENRTYFDSMQEFEKDLINIFKNKLIDIKPDKFFEALGKAHGVEVDKGEYISGTKETLEENKNYFEDNTSDWFKDYKTKIESYNKERKKAYERQLNRELENISLSEEVEDEKLVSLRKMFDENIECYQKNRDVFERLYQRYSKEIPNDKKYDRVIEKYAEYNGKGIYGAVGSLAEQKKKELLKRLSAIEEIIKCYVNNKWFLSDAAIELAKEEEIYRDIEEKRNILIQDKKEKTDNTALFMRIRMAHAVTKIVLPEEEQKKKKGLLQRIKESRLLKRLKAQYHNDEIDLVSYDIHKKIRETNGMKDNSLGKHNLINLSKEDRAVLNAFVSGYKTNENGDPIDATEHLKKEWDEQFIETYIYRLEEYRTLKEKVNNSEDEAVLTRLEDLKSDILKKRSPYLELITDEILNLSFDDEKFTVEYITKNASILKTIAEKIDKFKIIYDDEINNPFFENLSPGKKELIQKKLEYLSWSFKPAIEACISAKKVNYETGLFESNTSQISDNSQIMKNCCTMIKATNEKELSVYENELNERIENLKETNKAETLLTGNNFRFAGANSTFEYGLPNVKGLKNYLKNGANVSDEVIERFLNNEKCKTLIKSSNNYFKYLERIQKNIDLDSDQKNKILVKMYKSYQNFAEESAGLSYRRGTNKEEQNIIAALSNISMIVSENIPILLKNINAEKVVAKVVEPEIEKKIELNEEFTVIEEVEHNERFEVIEEVEHNERFEVIEEVEHNERFEVIEEVEHNERFEVIEEVELNERFEVIEEVELNEEFAVIEEVELNEGFAVIEEKVELNKGFAVIEEVELNEEFAVIEEKVELNEEFAVIEEVELNEEFAVIEEVVDAEKRFREELYHIRTEFEEDIKEILSLQQKEPEKIYAHVKEKIAELSDNAYQAQWVNGTPIHDEVITDKEKFLRQFAKKRLEDIKGYIKKYWDAKRQQADEEQTNRRPTPKLAVNSNYMWKQQIKDSVVKYAVDVYWSTLESMAGNKEIYFTMQKPMNVKVSEAFLRDGLFDKDIVDELELNDVEKKESRKRRKYLYDSNAWEKLIFNFNIEKNNTQENFAALFELAKKEKKHAKKRISSEELPEFIKLMDYFLDEEKAELFLPYKAKKASEKYDLIDFAKKIESLRLQERVSTLEKIAESEGQSLYEVFISLTQSKEYREQLTKYGILSENDFMIQMIRNTGNTPEHIRTVMGEDMDHINKLIDAYFTTLNLINNEQDDKNIAELTKIHRDFINTCENMSLKYQKKEDTQDIAASLASIGMKVATYKGMIANLASDFVYSKNIVNHEGSMKSHIDQYGIGRKYEGTHAGKRYDKITAADKIDVLYEDGKEIQRLDQIIRNEAKTAGLDYLQDEDFQNIIRLCETYENFLQDAEVPPCKTEEEQIVYREEINKLTTNLLEYHDRIYAFVIRYLDKFSGLEEKKPLCRILEKYIMGNSENSYKKDFEMISEFAYWLRHNDFSDTESNEDFTGVPLLKVLKQFGIQQTSIEKVYTTDDKDTFADIKLYDSEKTTLYRKTGGALSRVYIPKNDAEKPVLREGNTYRLANERIETEELKGGIKTFNTTIGRFVDSHKASRDVAISRVDKIFGADVIAKADYILINNMEETAVGTKMENARGKQASEFRAMFSDEFVSSKKNKYIDLSDVVSFESLYWLQVIDAICGSADRHNGNFFVRTDKNGRIKKLTGIDNDMAFGENLPIFKTLEEVHKHFSYLKDEYEIDIKGSYYTPVYEIAFPCVPLTIYDKVMELTPEKLEKELRGYLRDQELIKTVERLREVQMFFEELAENDGVFDMEKEEQRNDCIKIMKDTVDSYLNTGDKKAVCGNYFAMLIANTKSVLKNEKKEKELLKKEISKTVKEQLRVFKQYNEENGMKLEEASSENRSDVVNELLSEYYIIMDNLIRNEEVIKDLLMDDILQSNGIETEIFEGDEGYKKWRTKTEKIYQKKKEEFGKLYELHGDYFYRDMHTPLEKDKEKKGKYFTKYDNSMAKNLVMYWKCEAIIKELKELKEG